MKVLQTMGLAILGCALLSVLDDAGITGYPAAAIFILSILFILSSVLLAISTSVGYTFEQASKYYDKVYDAAMAIGRLTPERKNVFVVEELPEKTYELVEKVYGLKISILGFSLDPQKLKTFATGSLNGIPFSAGHWVGLKYGKLMSDREFRKLQDEFEERRCAYPKNPLHPNVGYDFTTKGWAALRVIQAAEPHVVPIKALEDRHEQPTASSQDKKEQAHLAG